MLYGRRESGAFTALNQILRKEPMQNEDIQLSFLLELNLLFDGSYARNNSKETLPVDSIAKMHRQNKTLEALLASLLHN